MSRFRVVVADKLGRARAWLTKEGVEVSVRKNAATWGTPEAAEIVADRHRNTSGRPVWVEQE